MADAFYASAAAVVLGFLAWDCVRRLLARRALELRARIQVLEAGYRILKESIDLNTASINVMSNDVKTLTTVTGLHRRG